MTIQGKKKLYLTKENILKKVNEIDIFKHYFKGSWELNVITSSPLREDKNPSFMVGVINGKLRFSDFGDSSFKGDCFQFVKDLYNLKSLDEVLRMIDKDLSLGFTSKTISAEKVQYKKTELKIKNKEYSKLDVSTKTFTKQELDYWNQYYIDLKDLKQENVFSINKIFLNGKKIYLHPSEMVFGYRHSDSWKIYRPLNDRDTKWFPNNVPIDTLDGKENIKNAPFIFINKSKKDYMVVKKLIPNSIAVQNEGMACFTKENVEWLKTNSKRQILSFDSDVPGVKNSLIITEKFGFDYCNVPRKFLENEIKDWADLAKFRGMDYLEVYFKTKKLIT